MTPVLRTPRLKLRPLREGDAERITALISDFEVTRWLSRAPHPYRLADAEQFLGDVVTEDGSGFHWAIERGGSLVGVIGTEEHLGYWLGREAWGQGIATEAGDAVLDAHFGLTAADEIVASYTLGNVASANVLVKLGFVEAGRKTSYSKALDKEMESQALVLTRARWRDRRAFRIETERLVIRETRDTDWPDLARIGGNPQVAPMLASVMTPWPEVQCRRWIAAGRYHGRPGFRATLMTKDDRIIGSFGFGKAPGPGHQSVAYFLDPEEWGKGYATEGLRAFLGFCFARFDVEVIEADHYDDNPASGIVMRRLGFEESGHREDSWSLARLEPAPATEYRLTRDAFEALT
ncbi:GNAT family N-acetyltransferase [Aestuariibius sp. 2305UL40-4]|uniref:GNAT family N-acetyltransferase n=1 Tax=Aestuariibius violaceus TaxID=3234132 RepID=UPI00345E6ADE